MNTPESQPTQAVAVQPKRDIRVVEDHGPLAHLFDTARFEHMQRIAQLMAAASLIPEHLKGRNPQETLGNCFLVVNQSVRWGFDPFAVAQGTYSVRGKLGFEGKIIAAVVNSRAGLDGPLNYQFNDDPDSPTFKQGIKGDALEVTVIGYMNGQAKTVKVTVGQARTDNQMWNKDPHQKLVYTAAVKWGRRWCPEVILGVLSDDDIERWEETTRVPAPSFIDATPRAALSQVVQEDDSNPELAPAKRARKSKEPEPDGGAESVPKQEAAEKKAPVAPSAESQSSQDPSTEKSAQSAQDATPVGEKAERPIPDFDHPQESLLALMAYDGITEFQMLGYLKQLRLIKPEVKAITELSATKTVSLFGTWEAHAKKAKEQPTQ